MVRDDTGDSSENWILARVRLKPARVAQLDAVDRSVVLLLLDGFSYREIAAIVGITESDAG